MTLSVKQFQKTLTDAFPGAVYLIAYSGGMDSHVLLNLCAAVMRQQPERKFVAVHVDHGLHKDSARWAIHCQMVCKDEGMPIRVLHVDAAPVMGQSPEEAARDARYAAMQRLLESDTVLMTAQHSDDQAETILLQLLRGGGLRGLSGMPVTAKFGQGQLYRPLLEDSRQSVLEYALSKELQWIDDPSNNDSSYDRNYLRREIIPGIRSRWPGMTKTLARSGRHCAQAQGLLESFAEVQLQQVRLAESSALSVSRLQAFSCAEQVLILRHWIRSSERRCPSQAILQRISDQVLGAAVDRSPVLRWSEGEIRRYRDQLFVMPHWVQFDSRQRFSWNGLKPLVLSDGMGTLEFVSDQPDVLAQLSECGVAMTVRFRTGGENCQIPGRVGHHTLKKIFQEQGVPPWLRDRIPLVYIGEDIAAIADIVVCEPMRQLATDFILKLMWSRHEFGCFIR